ncbi:RAB6-interacting golgin isoform X3 [Alosa alosa]|uniref:RAB6-interacting golgin isoform X3 n=1 Tax=Alosa alosa TaxID=278164 RepID=UPI0020152F0B|nr:RAB6-interacting golgin isoform X3 [Alosa alosa]
MASWAGFSDEELRRIQLKGPSVFIGICSTADQAMSTPGNGRGRKPTTTNRSRQQLQRERALKLAAQTTENNETLPPEQKLTKPHLASPAPTVPTAVDTRKDEPVTVKAAAVKPVTVKVDSVNNHDTELSVEVIPAAKELDKQEVELRERTRLEKLQLEQRIMEEKNKQKKALLTKTIAEKSKQTQAEAVKLKRIQKELQALDDSVSNDINILRKLIEQASLDYSTAWKRFERAEAEYVAAKLSLHRHTDVKEQLTEHLCAIIQQNELRKAAKLEELMQQLQLSEELESQPPPAPPGKEQPSSAQSPASPPGNDSTTTSTTTTTTSTTTAAGDPGSKQGCPEASPAPASTVLSCALLA